MCNYNGDRECPDCEIDSLVEEGLYQWKCLKCGRVFDTEWLDDGEEDE